MVLLQSLDFGLQVMKETVSLNSADLECLVWWKCICALQVGVCRGQVFGLKRGHLTLMTLFEETC